ncbi:glycosyltransferase family 4 protein [Cognataquiflexum rubidum]|uniref:glycosyltransferase family 4 protein n=1 Tax=Cognataquiflexum rubidum TaxID=2922273 RepID=UPI001F147200|nr:glycosyltransferase family 4 protein [Cognataquiflexum rubidum]MCH6234037.1 glycosyltransferase family 4 protein [Cognataquiflexum rubidum]
MPAIEMARLISQKFGWHFWIRHESGIVSVDQVYRKLDMKVARKLPKLLKKFPLDAVYAYEDVALESFIKAKNLGITCIYDLPIAYWETRSKIMKEEAERLPDWAGTLGGGVNDSPEKLARKTKELKLADIVIVPSQFVKESLPDWAKEKKVILSHFGSPEIKNESSGIIGKYKVNKSLRVLFVGSMGQRKGLGDLFEAVRLLGRNDIELVVMGSLIESLDFYKTQLSGFIYEPGRSHEQVLELMRTCDVFCLPSLAEGRALVMQEAMSQGLPLIITPNTGGEDLVIEGETGYLVPIRSPIKIAEKLTWFLENRDKIGVMGKKAQEHAKMYTWKKYGSKIVDDLIKSIN